MPIEPKPRPAWYLGVDLGQRRDYSALAVLELAWKSEGQDRATYQHIFQPYLILCALNRYPLGTSYLKIPQIIQNEITRIDNRPRPVLFPNPPAKYVVVDAGGPGAPVVELLRTARLAAVLRPILITSGQTAGHAQGGVTTIPRKALVSNLLMLLDQGSLRVPQALPNFTLLRDELLQLRAGDNNQPEKGSAHDDVVMAITLAVWQAAKDHPKLRPALPRTHSVQMGRLLSF